MKKSDFIDLFKEDHITLKIQEHFSKRNNSKIHFKGLVGSQKSLFSCNIIKNIKRNHFFILENKEKAAYFLNDLETLLEKEVLFFPESYKGSSPIQDFDNSNLVLRTEVLNKIKTLNSQIIVSYTDAIFEKVMSHKNLNENNFKINIGDEISIDILNNFLQDNNFENVDFVIEAGQYSIRGGIIDIFSYSNIEPYRIEFFDEKVETIRTFNTNTQLSQELKNNANITPNTQNQSSKKNQISFLNYIDNNAIIWIDDIYQSIKTIDNLSKKFKQAYKVNNENNINELSNLYIKSNDFLQDLKKLTVIEFGNFFHFQSDYSYKFKSNPQPTFNKQFNLLGNNLKTAQKEGYKNFILFSSNQQILRFEKIFSDNNQNIKFKPILFNLKNGFVDHLKKLVCYTDHEIFERYYKYRLKTKFKNNQAITLRQLTNLSPGDYVTHIDHGIGKFGGLHKIEINNKKQEAIKLLYKDNDTLFISIHSLHKISKYNGKDGTEPKINKLGSGQWQKTKNKAKESVKKVAYDLIKLYAIRKSQKGFKYSKDSFLQHELEASFIYVDTPDQVKATKSVKQDMESETPMDRLICGDVGFGKTEVAIRAAFKAVSDNKQVAVLVPTTILAMQHAKSFKKRLNDFPCEIDYINRFRNSKEQKEILNNLSEGKIDIIIGTHRLIGKDVNFKDLGLLIIDEEQKFGVSVKDKIKTKKANIDTLTLTATPIPRTLQFSLMGARDLSLINTPPENRYPIQTEVFKFNETLIKEAIDYEMFRNGQIYFVHNRVDNINETKDLIQKLCPNARIKIAHGQMDGKKLEQIMLSFMDGNFDVLVSTSIIENGLDIPNANTIIINNSNHFGLSDLHQMRGRVGRSNKKAFCFLLVNSLQLITEDAKKRLNALEQFSELGSGLNIAMRDLDIRGAGDILGAEQSGFINNIGFEMYHKILDESIKELKEEKLIKIENKNLVSEYCHIDTDLEILIPEEYISNVSERLTLYKEINELRSEQNILEFTKKLNDRFGDLPKPVIELVNSIRLRWLAKNIGFVKIILKNEKLRCYFKNKNSSYFEGIMFAKVINYLKQNHTKCSMKEKNEKLILEIQNIKSVNSAIKTLNEII